MANNWAAVIGVGLMGASMALALKKWTQCNQIVGIDPSRENLEVALSKDIINEGYQAPHEALKRCPYLFLAPPVDKVVPACKTLLPYLREGSILSDMGSTKKEILYQIERFLSPAIHFIGGHPMTGSEKIGPAHADPYLFENAYYILTPTQKTDEDALFSLTDLLQKIGARVITLSPERHDKIVSLISHLPQVLATTLINTISTFEKDPYLLTLAAGGLKDMTRIADSNPRMWEGIFFSNKKEILDALKGFKGELSAWEKAFLGDERDQVKKMMDEAKRRRLNIPEREKGLLPRFFEIHVAIPDRPLILGKITTCIGLAGINISDIEILKIRERGGALRLGFASATDRDRARHLLRTEGFQIQ